MLREDAVRAHSLLTAKGRMKYVLPVAILLALILFMAFLEGINAGTEERLVREAREKADAHRAILYANLLAQCFNGKSLMIEDQVVVDCKRRKK